MASLADHGALDPREVLRRNGRSFHFAGHLLGARHASRAARLYALCRAIDDLADEARDAAAADARLAALSDSIAKHRQDDPIALEALRLHRETGLDLEALKSLILGVRSDLRAVAIADEAALIDYAYAVAGTVGILMCDVLDVKDPAALPFAIDLGIGMQLTNIARDIGTDARLGRRYLPGAWVGHATAEELAEPSGAIDTLARKAVIRLLALAERYYESGEAGLGFLPPRARLAIFTAARVYRAIGRRIATLGYRPWRERATISTPRKVFIASGCVFEYLTNPRLKQTGLPHDARLHQPIRHRPGAHHG